MAIYNPLIATIQDKWSWESRPKAASHVRQNQLGGRAVLTFITLDEPGKHEVDLHSRSEAIAISVNAKVEREQSIDQETLLPDAFMRDKNQGLSEEQFDRISRTIAYVFKVRQRGGLVPHRRR